MDIVLENLVMPSKFQTCIYPVVKVFIYHYKQYRY